MFSSLTYFSQFKFVDFTFTEQFIQCESICTFQSSRRRHTCTQRHIAGESGIESFHVYATFDHFTAYTENVSCPACTGSILFVQTKFYIIFQVDRISSYFVSAVRFDFSKHTFVYSSGEYESTVVVSMFANQVDTTRRGIYKSCSSIKMLNEATSYVFYIHDKSIL